MTRFRASASLALAASVALALAGCSGGTGDQTDAPTEPAPEAIVVAQPADITTTDPIYDGSLYAVNVWRALYDQLFYMTADGQLEPRLVTEYSSNDDATVWNFRLRDDVAFHDGSPLTVDDVIFTFDTITDTPDATGRNYIGSIAAMEKVSDFEMNITLSAPTADFPRQAYYLSIVPSDYYSSVGPEGFAAAPIGSGPYSFTSWEPGTSIELTRNPDYWGEEAQWTEVSVVPVPDANARLNGVLSGDIDLTSIAPEQIPDVEAASGMKVQQGPSNQTVFLSSNINNGFLSDSGFRKAISLAIDRELLAEQLLAGAATPLGQTAPDVVTGHVDSIAAEPFDPDQARELVEASGYDGTPIPFQYPSDGNIVNSTIVAQAIAQQLGEVGITVELQGTDWASFLLDWNAKQMQGLYLFQFSPNAMDASSSLNLNYKSTGYVYWNDPELDALIAQAAATSDPDARLEVFADIWEYNLEQEYVMNLYGSENVVAMPSWMDFTVRGDGQVYFVDATAVE